MFEKMPKISSPLIFEFEEDTVYRPLSPEIKAIVDDQKVPLVKLHWRHINQDIPEQSNIAYLFKQVEMN